MRSSTTYALWLLAACSIVHAQTDPGARNGAALSGRPLPGLAPADQQAFGNGRNRFMEVENVRDGLGPRFNLDSCAGCHARPDVGGSSPSSNPQFAVALKNGAANHLPGFLQQNGPVRVVRFRRNADGSPDGGVHDLFTIAGRTDAPTACQITQPDFTNQQNIVFRIPTPVFGLGLIESITESALRANLAANANRKGPLGIRGRFNTSGNDGTITRYGWKAQNKSLLMFSGEAYNVEMGISNELFPQEREEDPSCATTPTPEDRDNLQAFSAFMRFLAPPQQAPSNDSIVNGRALFDSTGCGLCHTASLQTGNAGSPVLAHQTVNLFSDLALHRMGQALADGIDQGAAQGDEWRTAPLWGLGDRLFLLHDGRTKDLVPAITLHDSRGSEAHGVIQNFQGLTSAQKQDLLNFLRSL
jgi:CxxC motif-containing protein (DUF1111 family)